MPNRRASPALSLPKRWPEVVHSSVLHAISLAATALTVAWANAATSRSSRHRQRAEADRLRTEIALLEEEVGIKDARWSRVSARRRPHYDPVQRMRILQLRASRGWSTLQAAQRFLVTEETIASWIKRVDEDGENGLVRVGEPVNRFPDFVGYLVRHLKLLNPALGKVRIAQMLARAGLHLGVTTVGRMLKRDLSKDDVAAEAPPTVGNVVTAKHPNHIWHVDLTTVPTRYGFWVPWLPFTQPQRWPFCWWIAVALDHASRLVVGFALFKRRPTSFQVCEFLERAIKKAGSKPKYLITDKGKEFFCRPFRRWCRRRGIRPRFGAIGKHGSIAIIERFIRSMKTECTRRTLGPLRLDAMRHEIGCYTTWYNEHRPHRGLGGRTPLEVYQGLPPANETPRFEPRPLWPRKSPCARPAARVRGKRGTRLRLRVSRLENRPHLPVVEIRRAA